MDDANIGNDHIGPGECRDFNHYLECKSMLLRQYYDSKIFCIFGCGGDWYKSKRPDRREAIFAAFAMARPGDVILIAGKGPETYQDIRGRKIPCDDSKIAREALDQF